MSGSQKPANIALLMVTLAISMLILRLVLDLNSSWLGNFSVGSSFFTAIGFLLGVYSLFLKRSNSGVAAVVIGALLIIVFFLLILLFRDMCVICHKPELDYQILVFVPDNFLHS